jgi:hypothetical protein
MPYGIALGREVVPVDLLGHGGGLPLAAVVGVLADQLPFFCVRADERLAVGETLGHGGVDVVELPVAVGVRGGLLRLEQLHQPVAGLAHQLPRGRHRDLETPARQTFDHPAGRLGGPPGE